MTGPRLDRRLNQSQLEFFLEVNTQEMIGRFPLFAGLEYWNNMKLVSWFHLPHHIKKSLCREGENAAIRDDIQMYITCSCYNEHQFGFPKFFLWD